MSGKPAMPLEEIGEEERTLERWAQLALDALGVSGALVVSVAEEEARSLGGAGVLAGGGPPPPVGPMAAAALEDAVGVVAVDDARTDARARALARGPGGVGALAAAAIPGHPGSALVVVAPEPRAWTEADLRILRHTAEAAGMELSLRDERRALALSEAALQRSEAKFRSVFDNDAVGVALIGAEGWLIRTNRVLQKMLDVPEEQLLRTSLGDFVHPDEREALLEALQRVFCGSPGFAHLEPRLVTGCGSEVWARIAASLIRDRSGRPICGLVLVEDVSQRKQTEEALRESQRQLVFAQRMEAVGRLAGGIAHDFNNLLTAIGSFAQLLLMELEPDGEPALFAGEIQKASFRAASLTRQLLAFSRQQVLHPQRLDLNHVVRELEGMLRRLIGDHVELLTDLDPHLAPVVADPGQVEQVILNLVVNARDAMPAGGSVTLRTRIATLTPEQAASYPYPVRSGRYARLTVSDVGVGMDDETLARVFEPFFTTKEPGKGTGLGLSTAYGIVKQSGGYIWASSRRGEGTTFDVYLPLDGRVAEASTQVDGPAPVRGGAETVLLVEDEDLVRSLAERVLTRYGYTVLAASGGDEAVRIYEQRGSGIDLLLTDVVMPGMNGRVLAQTLLARAPHLRVLFMSGYTADAVEQYGIFDAGTAFLNKPFGPDELAARVRQVLDGE